MIGPVQKPRKGRVTGGFARQESLTGSSRCFRCFSFTSKECSGLVVGWAGTEASSGAEVVSEVEAVSEERPIAHS